MTILEGRDMRREKKEILYYGRQWIDEDDIKAVSDVLTSDFITCGPKVEEMEEKLASYEN